MKMKLMQGREEGDVKDVVIEIMKTIPAPALGNAASAVGLGINPYREGVLPVSMAKQMKWKKQALDKVKHHEINYFVV